MLVMVLAEIWAVPAERSRGRHNPRVVKRKMSNFPTRSRAAATDHRRWSYEDHIHVLPPTDLQPPAPLPKTPEPVPAAELPTTTGDRRAVTPDRQHVRAWRVSGLSRDDYCRHHALEPNAFNHWVDCQRPSVRPKYRNLQGDP
ncbi:IS66 family insertion sequence element accessory protein TnpA [Azospirillum largimobile]